MTKRDYFAKTNNAYVTKAIPANSALVPQRSTIPTMTISYNSEPVNPAAQELR
jgi:hypothetical protein